MRNFTSDCFFMNKTFIECRGLESSSVSSTESEELVHCQAHMKVQLINTSKSYQSHANVMKTNFTIAAQQRRRDAWEPLVCTLTLLSYRQGQSYWHCEVFKLLKSLSQVSSLWVQIKVLLVSLGEKFFDLFQLQVFLLLLNICLSLVNWKMSCDWKTCDKLDDKDF